MTQQVINLNKKVEIIKKTKESNESSGVENMGPNMKNSWECHK